MKPYTGAAVAIGLFALLATSAKSGDIYEPADPAAPGHDVSAPLWTGLYVGLHGGHSDLGVEVTAAGQSWSDSEESLSFGVHGGYMKQFGRFVGGIEVDYSIFEEGDEIDSASARGRLGVAFDNVLLYGTAGLGWLLIDSGDYDESLQGYIVGGGAEFALGQHVSGMSLGIEALYSDYEDQDFQYVSLFDGSQKATLDLDNFTVRAKLSFRFNP